MIPLIGASGLAVDSARGYLLKSRLSKSLDTAGLASGRPALNNNAAQVAREFFDINFGDSGTVTLDEFDVALSANRQFVTLSAEATTPTVFMRIFGQDNMTVSSRTVIESKTTGLELSLVLDNTGSMWGSKFSAMQAAAFDLVSIVYGGEDVVDNLWFSVVPYTATVNIGASRSSWLSGGDRVNTSIGDFSTPGWKGCVEARAKPLDGDETTPAGAAFSSYLYEATSRTEDNNWPSFKLALSDRNNGRGPNLGCGPEILPLTASKTLVDAAVGNMGAWHRGGTTGNLGLSWGWRTLSPGWRGLWGGATPATLPLDYDAPLMER